MNIIKNVAALSWRSNNHGVWKALVKDMAPNSSVTFSDGLTGTVAGKQVTVESPSMPTGFMTYTTDDDTAVFGGVLYGAGTASDSLEAVAGEKTVRMGSVDLGTLAWTISGTLFRANNIPADIKPSGDNNVPANAITAKYRNVSWITMGSSTVDKQMGIIGAGGSIAIRDNSFTDPVEFKASLSGVMLYYELATPTTSTETAQPMSLAQGSDTIGGGSFSATYEGTEYEIPLTTNCKYIYRDETGNDSLITGTASITSVSVKGGVSKLINLSLWFGSGIEPSITDFYELYPTWKTYDIPYMSYAFVNYKGTGVQTIGFNAYNHATGTAELLGGNKYQICGTYTSVSYVDQWGDTEELELDDQGIFTPTNNGTLTVVGGNATDTCVHLCWSGYKNFGADEYQWEPFVRNIHTIDVEAVFPDGMNGMGGVYDELYTDKTVKNFKSVDLGELTWTWVTNSTFGYWKTSRPNDIKTYGTNNKEGNVRSRYVSRPYRTWSGNLLNYACISIRQDVREMYVCNGSSTEPPSGLMIYQTTEAVTAQLPSPINLTYPVNDFGTEQSLPVNTTDLVTTDLHALIRYNTDYMRMNTQLSEIFPTVRSLAQQEQDGEIMKTDDTAPNATVGNAYNLIDRNAAGTERQFSFDTSGGTQDIADGTAIAKKLMGTTLNLNQLVHDTNENTVESVDGNATVEDAVAGQVKHLVVSGDTVVVNQLVHEYVEKTESGTGRIWIKDAFEKEAKGLKVTAPRSVVMNQLVQNGDFSNGTTGWSQAYVTLNKVDDYVEVTKVHDNGASIQVHANKWIEGHVYMLRMYIRPLLENMPLAFMTSQTSNNRNMVAGAANEWQYVENRATALATYRDLYIYYADGAGHVNEHVADVRYIQLVDLTQYFNGNQTLINSIQTWDDLVAYDSAFASYVQYNTGTVKGVTPALTLNGAGTPFATAPQELFGVGNDVNNTTRRDGWDVVAGKLTHRIGVVDLNTLTWSRSSYVPVEGAAYWSAVLPGGKKGKFYTLLTAKYGTNLKSSWVSMSDKTISSGENNSSSNIYIRDDALTEYTLSQFVASLSGVMLYYELETPVVTDVTPVAFDLVSHDNTIFQTSGDLQAGIEATYDGLNQTIALDPAHTYAFNHQYVEDSIITGESSIDCVGTEDNLVDLTQLYNGDATRISAIHSWASLSSRIHMYRDWLPYNPGEIVNLSATIRVYQHEHAYGVVYDPSQSSPACQRVELNDGVLTEVEEFTSLPVHDKFYRCVMDDLSTRHINYYLDDEDSTKKYNGTRNGVTSDGSASVLTGADGDVMVEIPITYWSLDEDYDGTGKILWLVSDTPFTGSQIHDFFYVSPNGDEARTQYVGAYRAVVADAEGNALNTTEGAVSQNAGTATTRLLRSVAGALPFNNVALASMREAAVRNGGSHVNHLFHEYLLMMMIVEQATLNCQSISMGYSNGKTNALWAWRKSGRTNYGNGTGQTMAVANTSDDDNFYSLKVNNVQLYRDANRDADGYFAWSNHAATLTVYWTESNVPGNGATAYSDSAGTDSGYTTTSWSTTTDANKVIQFQYRGIENPFGECWEFDDGMQKYQKFILTVIKVNNILHYVNHLKDGAGTKTAWTSEDGTSTYWTTTATPGNNAVAYSDADCTVDSGYKVTQNTWVRVDCEMWESVATADYTSTDQHVTATKVYNKNRHYWPSGSWIKKFDPRSFLPRTLGGSGTTYLCDSWYNDNGTGSRVVFVGGTVYIGSADGLGYRHVTHGLTYSGVNISGRLSA